MAKKATPKSAEDVLDLSTSAFSRWMQKAMIQAEMTVSELAYEAGVSQPTIYNIINGVIGNPQENTKKRIAKALESTIPKNVSVEDSRDNEIIGLGELTDFDPYDQKLLPSLGGVYVFYDIAGRPLYVGQSVNISRRVKTYSGKFWFKQPIVSSAAYVEIKDEKLRRQTESVLIKFLKSNAIINKQHVDRE